MISILNNAQKTLLCLFFFVYPIFFLDLTPEPAETSKLLLLTIIISLLLTISSLIASLNKKIHFTTTSFLIPFMLITFIYIVSTIFVSPNKIQPLIASQSTSAWVFSLLLLIFTSFQQEKLKLLFLDLTSIGSAIVALYILGMYLGIFPSNVITPLGNLLTTTIYFITITIYLIATIALQLSNKKETLIFVLRKNLLLISSLALILLASILLIFHLATDQKPILLPNSIGYYIFSKVARDPKSIFLGVGPANFIQAFTLEKPEQINRTPLWNITFTSSSSYFANLLTETGIISSLSFIAVIIIALFLLVKSLTHANTERFAPLVSLLILSPLLFFFLGTNSLLILFTSLIAGASFNKTKTQINLHKLSFLVYLIPIFAVGLSSIIFYFTYKAYLGEYYFYRAQKALDENNLVAAYNQQKQAVLQNPLLDKHHLGISQTSLLIASELLKKEAQTTEEKQQIPKLISQSIEEGRLAVNLNKTSAINWTNLAKIYSALITFAPGSETWAVEIAKQSIALDPNNPNQYLTLGQIYQKLHNPTEAGKYFKHAISLKNDLVLPSNRQPLPESQDKE